MNTVLFVHGTGVREPAYSASFSLVQQALTERLGATRIRLEPCYWGDSCGAGLFLGGKSIPQFDQTKSIGEETAADAEIELGLWAMLYEDPGAELQILALRGGADDLVPGRRPPGDELNARFQALALDRLDLPAEVAADLRRRLEAAGLAAHFAPAREAIADRPSYRAALQMAQPPLGEYRAALARALVAACARLAWDGGKLPDGFLPLDGDGRDIIVEQLVAALGGREAGVGAWLWTHAGPLVAGLGTRWFGKRRGQLSELAAPFGADVVAYQTRPTRIRQFIRDAVRQASAAARSRGEDGRITLLAHSLGGIAALDTLVEAPLPEVAGLITVGSQAPLLHELDALSSLELPRDASGRPTGSAADFPPHFTHPWLNIYDRRDFLSYRAEDVFGTARVADVEVDNRQPFPAAHSAYWGNARVWDAVLTFLDRAG